MRGSQSKHKQLPVYEHHTLAKEVIITVTSVSDWYSYMEN